MQVNMHEAKSQLSRLGRLAWEGEDIVIAKAGEPYLRLTPYRAGSAARQPGALEGRIRIADDFDEPAEDITAMFEDSNLFPNAGDS